MPRWQANAPERLVLAALDLFAEHGYENTTVIEIAERAGVTKSTFFRHFRDKREVLFSRETMSTVLVDAIAAAPADAAPLEIVASAIEAAGSEFLTPARRALGARRHAVIAASPELQEREALKGLALTADVVEALEQRGIDPMTARVAAELGSLAFTIAYDRWADPTRDAVSGNFVLEAMSELQAASSAALTGRGASFSNTA
jgi:AcrR family transcriptional regulator